MENEHVQPVWKVSPHTVKAMRLKQELKTDCFPGGSLHADGHVSQGGGDDISQPNTPTSLGSYGLSRIRRLIKEGKIISRNGRSLGTIGVSTDSAVMPSQSPPNSASTPTSTSSNIQVGSRQALTPSTSFNVRIGQDRVCPQSAESRSEKSKASSGLYYLNHRMSSPQFSLRGSNSADMLSTPANTPMSKGCARGRIHHKGRLSDTLTISRNEGCLTSDDLSPSSQSHTITNTTAQKITLCNRDLDIVSTSSSAEVLNDMDVSMSNMSLLTVQDREAALSAEKKVDRACICERSPKLILCKSCGATMCGRVRKCCAVHATKIFLIDLQYCTKCMSQNLKEICDYTK